MNLAGSLSFIEYTVSHIFHDSKDSLDLPGPGLS